MNRLLPGEKLSIECRVNSFNFSGLTGIINGKSVCRYDNHVIVLLSHYFTDHE